VISKATRRTIMTTIRIEEEGQVQNGIGRKNKQKDKEIYLMRRKK
jgi:hypothetical protein